MNKLQSTVRTIVYAIFAFIIGVILIRLLLKLIGANPDNQFAIFWYDFTDFFVRPWAVIYPSYFSGRLIFETYALIALIFYLAFSMIAEKGAISPFENTAKLAISGIIDALFKVIEFLLMTRFVFKITAASTSASFVRFIYDASQIVYEPFASLMPAIEIGKMRLEFSTIIALIVVIILDLVTNQLVYALLDSIFPDRPRKKTTKVVQQVKVTQPLPPVIQQVPVAVPVQVPVQYPQYVVGQAPLPPARPQNININIPPSQNGQIRKTAVYPVNKQQQVKKPQKRGFLNWYGKKRSARSGGPANS